jgi:hypothetical protein
MVLEKKSCNEVSEIRHPPLATLILASRVVSSALVFGVTLDETEIDALGLEMVTTG